MTKWKKRIAMFCIGLATGSLGLNIYAKNWKGVTAWTAAIAYAIAWRSEMEDRMVAPKSNTRFRNCDRFNTGDPKVDAASANETYLREGGTHETPFQWILGKSTERSFKVGVFHAENGFATCEPLQELIDKNGGNGNGN